MQRFSLLLVIAVLLGCKSAEYTAPSSSSDPGASVTLEQSYDETWNQMIQTTSQMFFGIEDYEKESGLMTLSFSGDPRSFVDCGTADTGGEKKKWLELWSERGAAQYSLDGKMNLTVEEVSTSKTRINVNTRYVLTGDPAADTKYRWVFNTGGSDTVSYSSPLGMHEGPRTCVPTHEAERTLIDALETQKE